MVAQLMTPKMLEEMFDVWGKFFGRPEIVSEDSTFIPRADIWEKDDAYYIHLLVPGLDKKDFEISLEENLLTIRGERKIPSEQGLKFHRLETPYGRFERTFKLPENIQEDKIQAVYEQGLLKLTIPKKKKEVTKIKVQVK